MRLGIMQPYFFPYLGYFDLINATDRWIVFDTVQYIRHGWMNRNRILHPNNGWQYIIAPLKKHHRNVRIYDVQIKEGQEWKERILGQINHYKKRAPNFNQVENLLHECLFDTNEKSLARFNAECLVKVCDLIGIPVRIEYFSAMNILVEDVNGPGDWALSIAERLGAHEYVNPPGGSEIFDASKFKTAGITLTSRQLPTMEYTARGYTFEPYLSIIDVLMWNTPEKVKCFLNTNQ